MKARLKFLPVILVATLFCFVVWALLYYEYSYLWKVQELNLFLDTSLFFKQQMVVAGGLLTYLGTFFTDFFFHTWLGVLMLCGWWAVLLVVSAMAFKMPMKWLSLLLIPIAMLVLSNMELGYWIYYLKLRGYFFVATIGMTGAVASVWTFRCLPSLLRPLFVALCGVVLYPLMGCYGLFALILMAIMSWRLPQDALKWRILNTVIALFCVLIVPMIFYRWVYYETNFDMIYFTALPLFEFNDFFPSYYLPFIGLFVSYVLLAVMYGLLKGGDVKKPLLWLTSQTVITAAVVFVVCHFWYRDYNFHKELDMNRSMEAGNWEEVLQHAKDLEDEPTRSIVLMKNLALFRLGRLGDEMFHFRQGAKASNTPLDIRMTQVVGRDIYFYYGQLNYCHRWCLEDGVEFGWRAVHLKYMTRCALLDGEDEVAKKYIGLLKHTRYHRAWAEEQEQYVGHREKLMKSNEYEPVTHMRDFSDILASDNGLVEYFLMHQIVNYETEDPVMQDMVLSAALWTKDIATFWPRFNKYALLHVGQRMPTHYQEAAYLYGHLENNVDISRMPFDESVKQNYEAFMALAQQCAGMSEEQMRPIFYPRFGHTFYYDYFLVRNQKLY